MKIKRVPTNECEITVLPRSAGDYGIMRISGRERTPQEEYNVCDELKREIKRHCDIGHISVSQKHNYQTEDGSEFEELYDAIENIIQPEEFVEPRYFVRAKSSEKDHFTSMTAYSFRELTEIAYRYPYEFSYNKSWTKAIDEPELDFIANVCEIGKNRM